MHTQIVATNQGIQICNAIYSRFSRVLYICIKKKIAFVFTSRDENTKLTMAALKSWFEPKLKACLCTCEFCETRGAWLCALHKLGRTLFTSALERNRSQLQLTVNAVMKLGSDT